MKKFFIYFLIIFFAIVLQVSSVPLFFKSDWPVDIVLMLVLAWTLIDGFDAFLKWAVFAGLLYDLATFSAVGLHVIIFALLAYSVSFFSKRFSVEIKGTGILLMMFFVSAATICSRAILLSHEFGAGVIANDISKFWQTLGMFSLAASCNLLIFFVLFFMLNWVGNFYYLKKN